MTGQNDTHQDNMHDDEAQDFATEMGMEDGAATDQGNIEAVIGALKEENQELKDRVLRAVAEMENLRKRTQREISDARTYAIAGFARDMLSATDNLERALATMPPELRQVSDPAVKSLIEGIEMTEREMQRLMQKNGVRPILCEGEKFDPHKHQAMFEVPNEAVPAGMVVQVVQSGFEIGDRVLRPAMVGISKGGPKLQQSSAQDHSNPLDVSDNSVTPESAQQHDFEAGEPEIGAPHVDKEV